jgi:predicted amidophosphoribosyltransferase
MAGQRHAGPIPPSKAIEHPEYDDRMLRLLRRVAVGLLDVRELLYQERSMDAAHASLARPRPEEIAANYRVREDLLEPAPEAIGLFDDVLTTGAHFKAAQQVLRRHFPATPILGIFLARTVRLEKAGDTPQLP